MLTVPVGLMVIVPVLVKNSAPLVVVPMLITAVPTPAKPPTLIELVPLCTKAEPLPWTFTVAVPGQPPG
jgi:hypothetical protein